MAETALITHAALQRAHLRERADTLARLFEVECRRVADDLKADREAFQTYVVGLLANREIEKRMFTP